MKRLRCPRSIGLVALVVLLAPGCVVEPDLGAEPTGADRRGVGAGLGDGGVNPCGPIGDLREAAQCDGFTEYVGCLRNTCTDGFDACLGQAWTSGRYSGSACEGFMACIDGSSNQCTHGCQPEGECLSCLSGYLGPCEAQCAEWLDCSGLSSGSGACSALASCCAAQPEALAELCRLDLADARLDGDDGCSGLLLVYCASP
jgi:hypothetical protein